MKYLEKKIEQCKKYVGVDILIVTIAAAEQMMIR